MRGTQVTTKTVHLHITHRVPPPGSCACSSCVCVSHMIAGPGVGPGTGPVLTAESRNIRAREIKSKFYGCSSASAEIAPARARCARQTPAAVPLDFECDPLVLASSTGPFRIARCVVLLTERCVHCLCLCTTYSSCVAVRFIHYMLYFIPCFALINHGEQCNRTRSQ
jgi:hypothetical protein